MAQARQALGRAPLWLGRSYDSHRLRFVQTARAGGEAGDGGAAGLVPFVRLDYGAFRIDEFGERRPVWLQRPPRRGTLLAAGGLDFLYGSNGLVLSILGRGGSRLNPQRVVALARTLRPAPLA